jgi:hypothetical protein
MRGRERRAGTRGWGRRLLVGQCVEYDGRKREEGKFVD